MSFFIDALRKLPDGTTTARRVGEYWTHDEAVTAARHLVDTFLYHEFLKYAAHGMAAEALFEHFMAHGEQPVILRDTESSTNVQRFDAKAYAKQRCAEICGGAKKS